MKLAHLADLHLGFRQYERMAAGGVNQRELDVEVTFARVIDCVIETAPDVVVVAGDLVHSPRPSTNAILALEDGFARLTESLPRAIIVVAAGNHDLSKTIGDKCILLSLKRFGVHVADRAAVRFYFADRDLSVLAVPDAPGLVRPPLSPDSRARFNALCLHGEVQGAKQGGAEHRVSTVEITRDELGADAWTWCAFGHYHQFEQLAPNAAYSGSIDYTSSNIWQEIRTPKGFVLVDLETRDLQFVEVAPARPAVDLSPIDATELGAADVDAKILEATEGSAVPIDDAIVRLRISGITRETSHALDQKQLRAIKRRALNFHMVEDRPARISPTSAAFVRAMNRRSVDERVKDNLSTRSLAGDVDRDRLVALGAEYLAKAGESELAKSTTAVTELAAITTTEQRKSA
ncbi:MAG TPA: DNA repair exonuclease [Gemmatimonadaceae bacterium]|jgi:DNA repair exonuclease SbcCD nuclease subunit